MERHSMWCCRSIFKSMKGEREAGSHGRGFLNRGENVFPRCDANAPASVSDSESSSSSSSLEQLDSSFLPSSSSSTFSGSRASIRGALFSGSRRTVSLLEHTRTHRLGSVTHLRDSVNTSSSMNNISFIWLFWPFPNYDQNQTTCYIWFKQVVCLWL